MEIDNDICPATTTLISSVNSQVSVGGVYQIPTTSYNTLKYFIEQLDLAKLSTYAVFKVTTCLFTWDLTHT